MYGPTFVSPQHVQDIQKRRVAQEVANIIFENSDKGTISLKVLVQIMTSYNLTFKSGDLTNLLASFPQLFERDGQTVTVTTQLDLCEAHCTKGGCSLRGICGGLHICKFYILNNSCRNKKLCKYGHNLQGDPFNFRLLQNHMLDQLPLASLRALLCRDRSRTTMPRICKFYNVGNGCKNGDKCFALHVCKHYLTSTCSFGQRCKRSHNIYDLQPKAVLKSHGFNVEQSPKATLSELREGLESVDDSSSTSSGRSSPHPGLMPRSHPGSPRRHSGSTPKPHTSTTSDDDSDAVPDVCMFHLRGQCSYGKACRNKHTDKPYLWQYIYWFDDSKWLDCSAATCDQLEQAYCDVNRDQVKVCPDKDVFKDMVEVNLEEMKYSHVMGAQKIRRLTTMSSVKNPSYNFTTRWQWWWLDETGVWQLYGQSNNLGMKTNVDPADLEKSFLDSPNSRVEFSTGEHRYILDFNTMTQQNKRFQTKRPVRRRPLVYQPGQKNDGAGKAMGGARPKTYAALKGGVDEAHDALFVFPPHWATDAKTDNPYYQLVEIFDKGSTKEEYQKASNRFHETVPNHKIKSIKRIQNAELWDAYNRCRSWMKRKLTGQEEVREMSLFHGTRKDYSAAICQQGFDWRICGRRVGTMYGQGSYFAKNAKYSLSYTDCSSLFLVKVLVGKYARGTPDLKRPPEILSDPHRSLYDSTVNDTADPVIFVTYKQEQSYPEFIIEYTQ